MFVTEKHPPPRVMRLLREHGEYRIVSSTDKDQTIKDIAEMAI